MQFASPQRRSLSIQLAPLIDVLLLLLIFYIVTSTFRTHRGIEMKLPEAESAETVPVLERLVLTIDAGGRMALNSVPMDVDRLQRELKAALEAMPEIPLELRADEAVSYGRIVDAVDAARQAGVRDLTAFTRPE